MTDEEKPVQSYTRDEILNAFKTAYQDWYLNLPEYEGSVEVDSTPDRLCQIFLRQLEVSQK
jgi:hypothetical protein